MLHLHVHPENPQQRLIDQAVERIRAGDVVVYPTDAAYAIGCQIGNKNAMERIAQIRDLGPKHQYAIMCCDLSDIATYAKVDNATYRLLKANTPAITTFILPATSEVPQEDPLDDPYDIESQLSKRIDVFIDGGFGTLTTTSIVDLSGEHPEIIRHGAGDVSAFE